MYIFYDTISNIVNEVLSAIFAAFNGLAWLAAQQTYNNLLVPEMSSSFLYPTIIKGNQTGFFMYAYYFSSYILFSIVDPLLVIVLLGIGFLYLSKVFFSQNSERFKDLIPKFILAVILSNFTNYISSIILEFGYSLYSTIYTFDGSKWTNFQNIFPIYSTPWTNNALLEFILKVIVLFTILAIAIIIGIRTGLLGVLIVLLPIASVLLIFPQTKSLGKKIWIVFIDMAVLPFFVLIPLILAVNVNNINTTGFILATGLLFISAGMPYFISEYGNSVFHMGFDKASNFINQGFNASMNSLSLPVAAATSFGGGAINGLRGSSAPTSTLLSTKQLVGNINSSVGYMAGSLTNKAVNKGGVYVVGKISSIKYNRYVKNLDKSSSIDHYRNNVGKDLNEHLNNFDVGNVKKDLSKLNKANDMYNLEGDLKND